MVSAEGVRYVKSGLGGRNSKMDLEGVMPPAGKSGQVTSWKASSNRVMFVRQLNCLYFCQVEAWWDACCVDRRSLSILKSCGKSGTVPSFQASHQLVISMDSAVGARIL